MGLWLLLKSSASYHFSLDLCCCFSYIKEIELSFCTYVSNKSGKTEDRESIAHFKKSGSKYISLWK